MKNIYIHTQGRDASLAVWWFAADENNNLIRQGISNNEELAKEHSMTIARRDYDDEFGRNNYILKYIGFFKTDEEPNVYKIPAKQPPNPKRENSSPH